MTRRDSIRRRPPTAPVIILCGLLVASCGERDTSQDEPSEPPKAESPTESPTADGGGDWLVLPNERVGPITRNSSEQALVEAFGADAVSPQLVAIGEGFCASGVVLFEGTPNEAHVIWSDSNRAQPAVIRMAGRGGDWRTARGVRVGTTLPELEALRDGPISFSGFGWDYGGGTGWQEEGGSVGLQLGYGPDDMSIVREDSRYGEIMGDREVSSDHPVIQMMNIHVDQLMVSWGYPASEVDCS